MIPTVAPLVGAWIEIVICGTECSRESRRSPRGSVDWNLFQHLWAEMKILSLPSWERGLKYPAQKPVAVLKSRSPRGSVDWNRTVNYSTWLHIRRSPRGSVDWNLKLHFITQICKRRSPRGSVDWNIHLSLAMIKAVWSLPSWERGLKCIMLLFPCPAFIRRSPRGSVDWNFWSSSDNIFSSSRSPRGSVDWNSQWELHRHRSLRSLPSWERGLKSTMAYTTALRVRSSLPSWERGLK